MSEQFNLLKMDGFILFVFQLIVKVAPKLWFGCTYIYIYIHRESRESNNQPNQQSNDTHRKERDIIT